MPRTSVRREEEGERFERESQALIGQDDSSPNSSARSSETDATSGQTRSELRHRCAADELPRAQAARGDGAVRIPVPTDGGSRDLMSDYLEGRPSVGVGRRGRRLDERAPGGNGS